MYSLQAKLDERLKELKMLRGDSKNHVPTKHVSKTYIKESLCQAGILDKKGKQINRVK